MSLSHKTISQVVLMQTKWKIKTYSHCLIHLLILQILMCFFNYGSGSGMSKRGNETFTVQTNFYSLDVFLMAACLWAFIIAFLLQTKGIRQVDLSIVTNRATGSIANALVLIIYSFLATIVIYMSLYIIVAFIQLFKGIYMYPDVSLFNFMYFFISFFMILLAASSGYFMSSLFNLSMTIGGFFVLILGYFIFRVLDEQLLTLLYFYLEAGYLSFTVKALISAILLFVLPVVFLNWKEVVRR
ncbi:hypothetical protein [Ureibacillus sp. GCM10028918]|uniref:hypothetical protein n=1 Tax=Ureibacillus sp. GCM10028918 TaxID=3273429 RepID=UPI0036227A12